MYLPVCTSDFIRNGPDLSGLRLDIPSNEMYMPQSESMNKTEPSITTSMDGTTVELPIIPVPSITQGPDNIVNDPTQEQTTVE